MKINYHNKRFRQRNNTNNQEASNKTAFRYRQQKNIVWGTYKGGGIEFGVLLAKVDEDGVLQMRYLHIGDDGEFRIGRCHSIPQEMPDGRLRLREYWQWIDDEEVEGVSEAEEVV